MAIDPICKMTVDEKTAKFTSEYKGKKYYFCAPGCKKKFDADPANTREPLVNRGTSPEEGSWRNPGFQRFSGVFTCV